MNTLFNSGRRENEKTGKRAGELWPCASTPVFSLSRFLVLLLVAAVLALCAPPAQAALNDWAPLTLNEQAYYGFTHVLTLDATNCTGLVTNAANAAANTLYPKVGVGTINFPAGQRINRVGVYVEKAFATSGGATACALNIGDSTVTNRFVSAAAIGTNAGTGVFETNLSTGVVGYNADTFVMVDKGTNHIYNTATNLTFHLLPVGDINANLTSGRIKIFLNAAELGRLKTVQ